MSNAALIALTQNAALLLAMVAVFDLATSRQRFVGKPIHQSLLGLCMGLLGIGLIVTAFQLEPGIVFDTRSVLLGICGLFFGTIPTVVAMVLTSAYRLSEGGVAAWPGVAVILTSGGLGLAWRHWRRQPLTELKARNLYLFGLAVHLAMLGWMMTLPWANAQRVLAGISLPVMLIFPAATMALGLLLVNRLRREADAQTLAESEARYRSLFENNHAIMLIIDPADGHIVDANPAASRFYGWPREELRRKCIHEINQLSPAQVPAELNRARTTQDFHFQLTHRMANGSQREVEIFSGPIQIGGRDFLCSIIHDVTERVRAETAVREQAALIRIAGRLARFGAWRVDLTTQRVFWSEEVAAIHETPSGFSPLLPEGIDFYAPEWRGRIAEVFSACARDGTPYDEELEIITTTKRRIWVRTLGEAVRDKSGKIVAVQGAFQDITDRKRAEAKLQRAYAETEAARQSLAGMVAELERTSATLKQSEALYRELFEANPHSMWVYDLENLRFLAVNDTAVSRYGYSRTDFLRMSLQDIRPAEDVPRLLEDVATRTSTVKKSGIWRHRTKTGEIILVEIASHSLVWEGRPARLVLAHDVTAREQARQALEASEQRLRQAILQAPFPIMLHAEDGEILQLSNSWIEITGYQREELNTVSDWTQRAYGERRAAVETAIAATYRLEQREYEGDFSVRTQSGDPRIWEFSSAPLGRLPDGRRLVISMAVDVTERRAAEAKIAAARTVLLSVIEDQKEAEAQVRRLNEELEERVRDRTAQLEAANRELESFCYAVSHDLRAPLRGMAGWSQALLEDCAAQLNEQGLEYLARLRAETQRMGLLIEDLLRLSRVTSAAMHPEAVDLSALAESIAARLRQIQPERTVEFHIQPGLRAHGDLGLLEVLLTNLMENAWKFSGRRAVARIEFGRLNQDGGAVFYVRDNGAGFNLERAPKLFTPFQRMHRQTDFPGTGIGLATVKRIVLRHGGDIWVETRVDQGATFFFTLAAPMCPSGNDPAD